ncbi:DEAD/DEAH box helicase family protein [bacterium]|nr:DEAD/DEAH box helicase family protein [bacterium]
MKLQFDKELDYQLTAINSVVDLFQSQTPRQANFTVISRLSNLGTIDNDLGIGNYLELTKEELANNLKKVQMHNGLAMTELTEPYEFDIEMETGTGKTYVYLRTIFELNKQYGFTKFIIVVPSVAIKEGVKKSLDIMQEHFKKIYNNAVCDYFIYDSSNLEQVRSFATSSDIQIMIITIDSFNKTVKDDGNPDNANIIHRPNDKLNGMCPITLIQQTNPFVIIDEPQSVDNTAKAKAAIKTLNPKVIFRYSATFRTKSNLIYKLDAVDAYDLQLVKQIEVASFASKDYHNKAYMKLISVDNKKSPITAVIEMDVKHGSEIKRENVTVKEGTDLYEKSKGRELYDGYIVNEIYCEKNNEYVDFTNREEVLTIGKVFGDIDNDVLKKQQIKKTIEEHLNKELRLKSQGIKVLSLFFIDKVANYRDYDENGNPIKGKYAQWFEQLYNEVSSRPKYRTLFNDIDLTIPVEKLHDGYFSKDKKGKLKDTKGNEKTDDDTYNTIMKNKEWLLSFECPLKFIFSHSALREGWDNPNVFQICTLNETNKVIKKRQEIGRGLRLCVNQKGERLKGFDINTLTIMANESYDEFAQKLQTEIEQEEGITFGLIEVHSFANIQILKENGEEASLGYEKSNELYLYCKQNSYIDDKGIVTDTLRQAIKENKVNIPEKYENIRFAITSILRKSCGSLNIKNADEKVEITLNKKVQLSPEFKELWDKIKWQTKYNVSFDSSELIKKCSKVINENVVIKKATIEETKAKLTINQGGVNIKNDNKDAPQIRYKEIEETEQILPDIVSYLQNETNLTRKSIVEILLQSNTLEGFKRNPQIYMSEVSKYIKYVMKDFIVDGIKYTKIGNDKYYAQELFETEEISGYLKNTMETQKSIYSHIIWDSQNEEDFANKFEKNDDIKLYIKLPDWFKIQTPIGTYNPDWAILLDCDGKDKIYFVLETKSGKQGQLIEETTRPNEQIKIKCGKKHFEALNTNIELKTSKEYNELLKDVART